MVVVSVEVLPSSIPIPPSTNVDEPVPTLTDTARLELVIATPTLNKVPLWLDVAEDVVAEVVLMVETIVLPELTETSAPMIVVGPAPMPTERLSWVEVPEEVCGVLVIVIVEDIVVLDAMSAEAPTPKMDVDPSATPIETPRPELEVVSPTPIEIPLLPFMVDVL